MAIKLPKYNLFIDKGWIEYDIEKGIENTLIIYKSSENELANSDFFTKILNSVNLKPSINCSILEISETDHISIALLINSNKFNKYLFFGSEPKNIGMTLQLNLFTIIKVDMHKFIQLPSLSQISQSIDFKKKLWEVLKDLYK